MDEVGRGTVVPSSTLVFRGWQKTSLIEYPGQVATVLFTGGCNFRCPYCYNVDLVLRPGDLAPIDGESVR